MSQDRVRRADVLAAYEDDPSAARKTGIVGFIIPVAAVAVLGAVGLFFYKSRVETLREVDRKVFEAREKARRHDLANLRTAEALYLEALDLAPSSQKVLGGLALTYFHQSQHGLETLSKSKDYLARLEANDAVLSERYATRAYIDIVEGRPEKAERDLKDLLERNLGDQRMAHALGWARVAQGDWVEGSRLLRQAIESDFSAVAFRFTLAELSHRNGDERGAVRQLDTILRSNMSPDHNLVKAWAAALRLKNYGNLSKPVQAISDLRDRADSLGAKAKGYLAWAEAELQIALMKHGEAATKIKEAQTLLPAFPPVFGSEARNFIGEGRPRKAVAAFRRAIEMEPPYRGLQWELARFQSRRGLDAALAIVDALERGDAGTRGAEYELFRGNHKLRMGDLDAADTHFKKAADLGDDPDILFGLAKVTFERQKRRGNKADLEAVAQAIQLALDKKRLYPEAHEYVAGINLWNYQIDSAHNEFQQAEAQFKKLRRPIPEVMAFYRRVQSAFAKLDAPRKVRRQAARIAQEWQQKRGEYARSLVTGG